MKNLVSNESLIYKQYYDKVLRYVRKSVSNQDEVDDIVSEIFIKIFTNLDKYDKNKASLSTWIYLISSRTVIDFYRRNSKFSALSMDSLSDQSPNFENDLIDDDIDADLLTNETLDELASALEMLDTRERDLIVLKYYKKESLKKIAGMMNLSYSTVKLVHKRALNNLKIHIKNMQ